VGGARSGPHSRHRGESFRGRWAMAPRWRRPPPQTPPPPAARRRCVCNERVRPPDTGNTGGDHRGRTPPALDARPLQQARVASWRGAPPAQGRRGHSGEPRPPLCGHRGGRALLPAAAGASSDARRWGGHPPVGRRPRNDGCARAGAVASSCGPRAAVVRVARVLPRGGSRGGGAWRRWGEAATVAARPGDARSPHRSFSTAQERIGDLPWCRHRGRGTRVPKMMAAPLGAGGAAVRRDTGGGAPRSGATRGGYPASGHQQGQPPTAHAAAGGGVCGVRWAHGASRARRPRAPHTPTAVLARRGGFARPHRPAGRRRRLPGWPTRSRRCHGRPL